MTNPNSRGHTRGCHKKKRKVSNTPYLTKAPALRDTHNTPTSVVQGYNCEKCAVTRASNAGLVPRIERLWSLQMDFNSTTVHSIIVPCFMALHTSLSTSYSNCTLALPSLVGR